jgi:hypothetical protein
VTTSEDQNPTPMPAAPASASHVDRRSMLRRGAIAAVAGVAATGMLANAPAGAAPGDNLVIGTANDSGAAQTSLTSSIGTAPTLSLANSGNEAPLGLVQQSGQAYVANVGGELANLDGLLYYAEDFGGQFGVVPGFVFTEFSANQVMAITPQRVVDTRKATARTNITNAGGNLDSSGRLLAGHAIVIDLSGLAFAAESAFCNVTVVTPTADGFVTVYPGATRPATSSINYFKNITIANFAVCGVSSNDTVSVYAAATTHVILDILAFNVGNPSQINPAVIPSASGASATAARAAARVRAGAVPSWYGDR